ncbi:MAG: RNA polymerase sigma factor [Dyadobacter fermentans]
METEATNLDFVPHLFRQEYAKMTAFLCRHFGLKDIHIAEDIASDTFLKASEHWALNGTPQNPTAWLYTVAKNKARDELNRIAVLKRNMNDSTNTSVDSHVSYLEVNPEIIADSQLAMIFAVCDPANSASSQICLALQILCGFSVEEIADAFLIKYETVKKQLYRARTNLRKSNFQIIPLTEAAVESRLDTVLKTLYLLFNEGYFSKSNMRQIRKELCSEAVRLMVALTNNKLTNKPQVNALLALMCYQSSRLDARITATGEVVLYDDQDQNLWDQALIQKGNFYLVNATNDQKISKYHLEAGIAYWHTSQSDQNKWEYILQLYNQLILIDHSPMAALNRIFALAKVKGENQALKEAEKLGLVDNSEYHQLLGYLYELSNPEMAIQHYQQAILLLKSETEKQALAKKITLLYGKLESDRR